MLLCSRGHQHEIRQRLIEGTLARVEPIARCYQDQGIALADLIGEANLALVQAAHSFLPAPNRLFRDVAARQIHRSLSRLVKDGHQTMPSVFNTEDNDLLLSLDAPLLNGKHEKKTWDEEDTEESPSTLFEVLAQSAPTVSNAEEDPLALQFDLLAQALTFLPQRQRQVLELRYRIGEASAGASLRPRREVGQSMGVSGARIRQVEERALHTIQWVVARKIPKRPPPLVSRPPQRQKQPPPLPSTETRPKQAEPQDSSQSADQHPWTATAAQVRPSDADLLRDDPPRSPQAQEAQPPAVSPDTDRPTDLPPLDGTRGPLRTSNPWKIFLSASSTRHSGLSGRSLKETEVHLGSLASHVRPSQEISSPAPGLLCRAPGPLGRLHDNGVSALQWSPDGAFLALVDLAGAVRIYHADSGELVTLVDREGMAVSPVCWSPDGSSVAAAEVRGGVLTWNAHTGQFHRHYTAHQEPMRWLSWSPGGRRFASADLSAVHIWVRLFASRGVAREGHT